MFERKFDLEEKYQMLTDLLVSSLLLIYSFIVNAGIRISGLYMDDLYMWSTYGEESFINYVFPLGSTRFRPVYWFLAWIELGIIRNNITWIVTFNIIFAAAIAIFIYIFAKKLSGSRIVSVLMSVIFLSSRFSYYNISQLLGFMEALCLAFLLAVLYLLYTYMTQEGKENNLYIAVVMYILISFTHERYMLLLPLFIYAIFIKKGKLLNYIFPLLAFGFIQVMRFIFIGTVLPAGTSNTKVVDTFNMKDGIKNAFAHVLYMIGINDGPEHLNGVPWADTALIIKYSVGFSILILLIIFTLYIYKLTKNIKKKHSFWDSISSALFYLIAICLCIASSSVTIRVELRWVYGPFICALLLLSYVYGEIKRLKLVNADNILDMDFNNYMPLALVVLWCVSILPMDLYAHTKYHNIYIYQYQSRYNSLADASFGKYKEEIFDKDIYIIGNYYEMSEFTANNFFKVFDKHKKADGLSVHFIDSYRDLGQISQNMLVLKEEIANNAFTDVTDMIRNVKCEIIKGYYRDGWMDKNAEIYVMADKDGNINLELMYPADLFEGQQLKLVVDDSQEYIVDIDENITYFTVEKEPFAVTKLNFSYNFELPDAQEQRGDDKFSMIVNIIDQAWR